MNLEAIKEQAVFFLLTTLFQSEMATEKKFCLRLHKQLSYKFISPNVLKSALQKYIRTNNFEKCLWSLIELDLFGLLENVKRITYY